VATDGKGTSEITDRIAAIRRSGVTRDLDTPKKIPKNSLFISPAHGKTWSFTRNFATRHKIGGPKTMLKRTLTAFIHRPGNMAKATGEVNKA
jgi:hypothetical protein